VGADGYLTKTTFDKDVLRAVYAVISGEMVITRSISHQLLAYASQREDYKTSKLNVDKQLTSRELQTLRLLAKGLSNKEIAISLDISPRTVKAHLLTLFARLDAKSRTESVIIGLRRGLISMDDIAEDN